MSTRCSHCLLLAAAAVGCARRRPADVGPPGPWVTSEPPGLQIILDGQAVGRVTPTRLESWEPILPHEILIEAPGRVPFRLSIPAGDSPARVEAKLPLAGYVEVESDPPGAAILIGGAAVASSPAKVPVAAGMSQKIVLSLDGHLSEAETVSPPAGETVVVRRRLRPAEIVDFQSDPEGASVVLDGAVVGRAPLQLPVAADRSHLVRMSMAGLLPCERRFQLTASTPRTVGCNLDDERAKRLRDELRRTELSLKVARKQRDALRESSSSQFGAAMALERRRNRLDDLIQRLSDEEDREQGEVDAHRTELEERFERPSAGDGRP
ncbi:MAG: PEGA domain-containing protein [Myxococcales bacterium]